MAEGGGRLLSAAERGRARRYVLLLGVASLLVFLAFNGIQVLETSQNHEVGYYSLTTVYATLALGNFVAPLIIGLLGHRVSLFLGTLTYMLFVAANLWPQLPLMIPASVLLGLGAALYWTTQGAYVTMWGDRDTMGSLNGLFFALFMGNYVVGNIISGLLFQFFPDPSQFTVLLYVYIAVSGAGCALMLFLRPREAAIEEAKEALMSADGVPMAGRQLLLYRLSATFRMFADRSILMLLPLIIYSGLSQQYFYGQFTGVIHAQMHDLKWVSFAMIAYGVMEVVGSIVVGPLSDRIGRVPIVLAMFVLHAAGLAVTLVLDPSKVYLYFVAAILCGVGDSIGNTQIAATLGFLYPTRAEPAFAVYKLVQALMTAASFYYASYVDLFVCAMILFPLLVIGVAMYTVLGCIFVRLDNAKSCRGPSTRRFDAPFAHAGQPVARAGETDQLLAVNTDSSTSPSPTSTL